jgi:hypothetical protein
MAVGEMAVGEMAVGEITVGEMAWQRTKYRTSFITLYMYMILFRSNWQIYCLKFSAPELNFAFVESINLEVIAITTPAIWRALHA